MFEELTITRSTAVAIGYTAGLIFWLVCVGLIVTQPDSPGGMGVMASTLLAFGFGSSIRILVTGLSMKNFD